MLIEIDKILPDINSLANVLVDMSKQLRKPKWEFTQNWEPNHKHWVAPSSFEINNDGTMTFKVAHLANMFRWPGPVDDGPGFDFLMNFKCLTGPTKFDIGILLATLGYRQKLDNAEIHINQPGWGKTILEAYIDRKEDFEISRAVSRVSSNGSGLGAVFTWNF